MNQEFQYNFLNVIEIIVLKRTMANIYRADAMAHASFYALYIHGK
jgi:hypothetical protein